MIMIITVVMFPRAAIKLSLAQRSGPVHHVGLWPLHSHEVLGAAPKKGTLVLRFGFLGLLN